MRKQDLVLAVAMAGDMPRARAARVVEALLRSIGAALRDGEEVRLAGFGTFSVSHRPAKIGRNPRTGEPLAIPAVRTVRFRPGKMLRKALAGAPPPPSATAPGGP